VLKFSREINDYVFYPNKDRDRDTHYGSRIKWHLFLFFSMGAHTKEEKRRPFYSAAVLNNSYRLDRACR
jgi:hypothetical protein